MKPVIKAILIGIAIAGVVYYLRDDKKVKKTLSKFTKSAKEEMENVDWKQVGTRALTAVVKEVNQPETHTI